MIVFIVRMSVQWRQCILTHGHASLCRKLSKVVNFPLWYFYNLFWTQKELIIHISNGVSMNCCKFLETLKSEINSLYHVKNTQKPFPTGQHCFWKYCQTNSFNDFPRHFRKTSSKQNEIVGKMSLTLFR